MSSRAEELSDGARPSKETVMQKDTVASSSANRRPDDPADVVKSKKGSIMSKFKCLSPLARRAHQVMDQVAVPVIERTSMEIRAAHGSDWASLPTGILASICEKVMVNSDIWPNKKVLFAVSGTCSAWRSMSHEIFYQNQLIGSTISHPMELFLTRPYRSIGSLLHCLVVREREPNSEHGTQYYMYLGEPEMIRFEKLLLAASHHAKMGQKRFSIRLGRQYSPETDANDCVASLKTNLLGTSYGLEMQWDPEILRAKRDKVELGGSADGATSTSSSHEIGKMQYRRNFFGIRGPRKLSVQIPTMAPPAGQYAAIQPSRHIPVPRAMTRSQWHHVIPLVNEDGEFIAEDVFNASLQALSVTTAEQSPARAEGSVVKMKNVPPHWHEVLQCWCLNFGGRVKEASVKNFQLMDVQQPDLVAMQFGKVSKDRFILDFNPTIISPIQAFAVALSSFESKLPYE
eukprot:scaffold95087_cov48-Prasinocladus_malaysianus.AAC.1